MTEISVIIPCFNSGNTIIRTLKSLENQTLSDFEVLIIDDGSIDGTVLKIKKYLKKSRLQASVICQGNQGVSAARNRGIKYSQGKYIAFLDSDDCYRPDFLKMMVQAIEVSGTDLAMARFAWKSAESGFEKKHFGKYLKKHAVKRKRQKLDRRQIFTVYNHHRKEKIHMASCIYRRELIEGFDIWFCEGRKYGEDTEFFLAYARYCVNGAVLLDKELYEYYRRKNSVTKNVCYEMVQNVEAHKQGAGKLYRDGLITPLEAEYAVARALWAVAKDFCLHDGKLFERLKADYDVAKTMGLLCRYSDEWAVRVSALLYLISDRLFLVTLRIFYSGWEKKCT